MSSKRRLERLERDRAPGVGGWRSDPEFAAWREARFEASFGEPEGAYGGASEQVPTGVDPLEAPMSATEDWRKANAQHRYRKEGGWG